jgi:hypothetical protein
MNWCIKPLSGDESAMPDSESSMLTISTHTRAATQQKTAKVSVLANLLWQITCKYH